MEQKTLFNIGLILLFATVIVMLLYGVLYVSIGSLDLTGALTYIGKTEAQIIAFDPELMVVIIYQIRITGIAYISLGIAYLFILNFGFRKKEKWAWIATIIAVAGFVVPLLLMSSIILGIDIDVIILIIILIIQIVGVIITYKNFFRIE